MLCKYRNALGEPGKGVHFHVLGIAVVDMLMTVLAAFIISRWTGKFWLVLVILFLLGIILHRIFCVNTTINKLIFGKV